MTNMATKRWEAKRNADSKLVEDTLKQAGFNQVDAYRYNSASIRVRVIDPRFQGQSIDERDAMVEPHLAKLPERIQADIVNLLTFAPDEVASPDASHRSYMLNAEFEDPSPSML